MKNEQEKIVQFIYFRHGIMIKKRKTSVCHFKPASGPAANEQKHGRAPLSSHSTSAHKRTATWQLKFSKERKKKSRSMQHAPYFRFTLCK